MDNGVIKHAKRPTDASRSIAGKKGIVVHDVEVVDIDSIHPNTYNSNYQGQENFDLLIKSIKENGFTQPVFVNLDGTIIEGEHRWTAAKFCGYKTISVVRDTLSGSEQRIATLRHNRVHGKESARDTEAIYKYLEENYGREQTVEQLQLSSHEVSEMENAIEASTILDDIEIFNSPGEAPREKPEGKSPITYWGGKKTLAPNILAILPKHKLYVEPFLGGGSVFFSKKPSTKEIINDKNQFLMKAYCGIKYHLDEVIDLMDDSLLTRETYKKAQQRWATKDMSCTDIECAWCVLYMTPTSFQAKYSNTISLPMKDEHPLTRKFTLYKKRLREQAEWIKKRLEHAFIESDDAIGIIHRFDDIEAAFYCDPPYINTPMEHYRNYTADDYDQLLDTLAAMNGKFVLSSYINAQLNRAIKLYKWNAIAIKKQLQASAAQEQRSYEVEMIVANFPFTPRQLSEEEPHLPSQ